MNHLRGVLETEAVKGVGRREGRIGLRRTYGGRLFMFTICCVKLKVAVIMACEAVSWSPVSTRIRSSSDDELTVARIPKT